MGKLIQKIYTIWCAIVFSIVFIALFPLYLIIIPWTRLHTFSFYLNKIWANSALFLVGIEAEIIGRNNLDPKQQYVYCANHFSLLDILSFGFAPSAVLFVGKASLAKIPLFGLMFRKIHVTVNRSSIKNSYVALQTAISKMGDNKSLVMFPEGGIHTKNPPKMVRFKDGAFRVAIEKQIPLVPVTLPDNWIILPDGDNPLIKRKKMRMIFHEPISTEGLNIEAVSTLKERIHEVIQNELDTIYNVK